MKDKISPVAGSSYSFKKLKTERITYYEGNKTVYLRTTFNYTYNLLGRRTLLIEQLDSISLPREDRKTLHTYFLDNQNKIIRCRRDDRFGTVNFFFRYANGKLSKIESDLRSEESLITYFGNVTKVITRFDDGREYKKFYSEGQDSLILFFPGVGIDEYYYTFSEKPDLAHSYLRNYFPLNYNSYEMLNLKEANSGSKKVITESYLYEYDHDNYPKRMLVTRVDRRTAVTEYSYY